MADAVSTDTSIIEPTFWKIPVPDVMARCPGVSPEVVSGTVTGSCRSTFTFPSFATVSNAISNPNPGFANVLFVPVMKFTTGAGSIPGSNSSPGAKYASSFGIQFSSLHVTGSSTNPYGAATNAGNCKFALNFVFAGNASPGSISTPTSNVGGSSHITPGLIFCPDGKTGSPAKKTPSSNVNVFPNISFLEKPSANSIIGGNLVSAANSTPGSNK